ncbi:hypothetical protein B0H21DRAFT_885494 [Amylocystis lapponica]|nr:hypothetical protein B0H21DRAFT_885494 [Amylocystis lapponica]
MATLEATHEESRTKGPHFASVQFQPGNCLSFREARKRHLKVVSNSVFSNHSPPSSYNHILTPRTMTTMSIASSVTELVFDEPLESLSPAGMSQKKGLSHSLSPSSNLQRGEEYQAITSQILSSNVDNFPTNEFQALTRAFERLQEMHTELEKNTSLSALNDCKEWKRRARMLHDNAKRSLAVRMADIQWEAAMRVEGRDADERPAEGIPGRGDSPVWMAG